MRTRRVDHAADHNNQYNKRKYVVLVFWFTYLHIVLHRGFFSLLISVIESFKWDLCEFSVFGVVDGWQKKCFWLALECYRDIVCVTNFDNCYKNHVRAHSHTDTLNHWSGEREKNATLQANYGAYTPHSSVAITLKRLSTYALNYYVVRFIIL